MIRTYGDFDVFVRFISRKNKAKQTQSWLAPSTAGGQKTDLKKQSQFTSGANRRKLFFERILWQ